MQFEHYADEDTLFVKLGKGLTDRTRELDDRRDVGLNEEGGLEWIVFHSVSEGVDLGIENLTSEQLKELSRFLEDQQIPVFA